MFGITTSREPVKGEFAKKINASVAKMQQRLAVEKTVAKSTVDSKYTVVVRG